MRAALPAAIFLAGAVFARTPSVQAAQCVTVAFFDQDGGVIETPKPVIALLVGGQPALTGVVPDYFTNRAGNSVPCPDQLVQEMRELFNRSCLSEERRNRAAKDNKVDVANINKGCANMMESLRDPLQH